MSKLHEMIRMKLNKMKHTSRYNKRAKNRIDSAGNYNILFIVFVLNNNNNSVFFIQ